MRRNIYLNFNKIGKNIFENNKKLLMSREKMNEQLDLIWVIFEKAGEKGKKKKI